MDIIFFHRRKKAFNLYAKFYSCLTRNSAGVRFKI